LSNLTEAISVFSAHRESTKTHQVRKTLNLKKRGDVEGKINEKNIQ